MNIPVIGKVRWLVVGIGDVTRKRVIPAIQSDPASHLAAVFTRDASKADAYPGVRVWTSLEAAASDAEVDAVYVASPVALHAAQSIAFMRAGKHVLCEKPVALNYYDAAGMAAAARDLGRTLGVAYFRRLFPKLIRAKQLIAEGAIGQPVLAQANFHGWLESEERAWLRDPELAGGGPLFDTGSHRIDAFNFLFGKPVRAAGIRSRAVHRFGVEDSASVVIGYDSGVHASVDTRWNSHVQRDEFRIFGTDGEINLTPLQGPILLVIRNVEHRPCHENVHYPVVADFAQALLTGRAPACPIEQAIFTDWVTSRVCEGEGKL